MRKLKIISGGQTGADSAALEFAIRHRLPHGGWCPRGRKREDGCIPARFKLRETPRRAYIQRTEWNVRDADATVIFSLNQRLTGGTKRTLEYAQKLFKPYLHLAAIQPHHENVVRLRRFLRQYRVRILNVAGPRKSSQPEVGRFVARTLRGALMSWPAIVNAKKGVKRFANQP